MDARQGKGTAQARIVTSADLTWRQKLSFAWKRSLLMGTALSLLGGIAIYSMSAATAADVPVIREELINPYGIQHLRDYTSTYNDDQKIVNIKLDSSRPSFYDGSGRLVQHWVAEFNPASNERYTNGHENAYSIILSDGLEYYDDSRHFQINYHAPGTSGNADHGWYQNAPAQFKQSFDEWDLADPNFNEFGSRNVDSPYGSSAGYTVCGKRGDGEIHKVEQVRGPYGVTDSKNFSLNRSLLFSGPGQTQRSTVRNTFSTAGDGKPLFDTYNGDQFIFTEHRIIQDSDGRYPVSAHQIRTWFHGFRDYRIAQNDCNYIDFAKDYRQINPTIRFSTVQTAFEVNGYTPVRYVGAFATSKWGFWELTASRMLVVPQSDRLVANQTKTVTAKQLDITLRGQGMDIPNNVATPFDYENIQNESDKFGRANTGSGEGNTARSRAVRYWAITPDDTTVNGGGWNGFRNLRVTVDEPNDASKKTIIHCSGLCKTYPGTNKPIKINNKTVFLQVTQPQPVNSGNDNRKFKAEIVFMSPTAVEVSQDTTQVNPALNVATYVEGASEAKPFLNARYGTYEGNSFTDQSSGKTITFTLPSDDGYQVGLMNIDSQGQLKFVKSSSDHLNWNANEEIRYFGGSGPHPANATRTPLTKPITVSVSDSSTTYGSATITPVFAILRDTDSDGTPDIEDPDDDGDGFSDEYELNHGTSKYTINTPNVKLWNLGSNSEVTDAASLQVEVQDSDTSTVEDDDTTRRKYFRPELELRSDSSKAEFIAAVDPAYDGLLTVNKASGAIEFASSEILKQKLWKNSTDTEKSVAYYFKAIYPCTSNSSCPNPSYGQISRTIKFLRDRDNDGWADKDDPDIDGDGIPNEYESGPAKYDSSDATKSYKTRSNTAIVIEKLASSATLLELTYPLSQAPTLSGCFDGLSLAGSPYKAATNTVYRINLTGTPASQSNWTNSSGESSYKKTRSCTVTYGNETHHLDVTLLRNTDSDSLPDGPYCSTEVNTSGSCASASEYTSWDSDDDNDGIEDHVDSEPKVLSIVSEHKNLVEGLSYENLVVSSPLPADVATGNPKVSLSGSATGAGSEQLSEVTSVSLPEDPQSNELRIHLSISTTRYTGTSTSTDSVKSYIDQVTANRAHWADGPRRSIKVPIKIDYTQGDTPKSITFFADFTLLQDANGDHLPDLDSWIPADGEYTGKEVPGSAAGGHDLDSDGHTNRNEYESRFTFDRLMVTNYNRPIYIVERSLNSDPRVTRYSNLDVLHINKFTQDLRVKGTNTTQASSNRGFTLKFPEGSGREPTIKLNMASSLASNETWDASQTQKQVSLAYKVERKCLSGHDNPEGWDATNEKEKWQAYVMTGDSIKVDPWCQVPESQTGSFKVTILRDRDRDGLPDSVVGLPANLIGEDADGNGLEDSGKNNLFVADPDIDGDGILNQDELPGEETVFNDTQNAGSGVDGGSTDPGVKTGGTLPNGAPNAGDTGANGGGAAGGSDSDNAGETTGEGASGGGDSAGGSEDGDGEASETTGDISGGGNTGGASGGANGESATRTEVLPAQRTLFLLESKNINDPAIWMFSNGPVNAKALGGQWSADGNGRQNTKYGLTFTDNGQLLSTQANGKVTVEWADANQVSQFATYTYSETRTCPVGDTENCTAEKGWTIANGAATGTKTISGTVTVVILRDTDGDGKPDDYPTYGEGVSGSPSADDLKKDFDTWTGYEASPGGSGANPAIDDDDENDGWYDNGYKTNPDGTRTQVQTEADPSRISPDTVELKLNKDSDRAGSLVCTKPTDAAQCGEQTSVLLLPGTTNITPYLPNINYAEGQGNTAFVWQRNGQDITSLDGLSFGSNGQLTASNLPATGQTLSVTLAAKSCPAGLTEDQERQCTSPVKTLTLVYMSDLDKDRNYDPVPATYWHQSDITAQSLTFDTDRDGDGLTDGAGDPIATFYDQMVLRPGANITVETNENTDRWLAGELVNKALAVTDQRYSLTYEITGPTGLASTTTSPSSESSGTLARSCTAESLPSVDGFYLCRTLDGKIALYGDPATYRGFTTTRNYTIKLKVQRTCTISSGVPQDTDCSQSEESRPPAANGGAGAAGASAPGADGADAASTWTPGSTTVLSGAWTQLSLVVKPYVSTTSGGFIGGSGGGIEPSQPSEPAPSQPATPAPSPEPTATPTVQPSVEPSEQPSPTATPLQPNPEAVNQGGQAPGQNQPQRLPAPLLPDAGTTSGWDRSWAFSPSLGSPSLGELGIPGGGLPRGSLRPLVIVPGAHPGEYIVVPPIPGPVPQVQTERVSLSDPAQPAKPLAAMSTSELLSYLIDNNPVTQFVHEYEQGVVASSSLSMISLIILWLLWRARRRRQESMEEEYGEYYYYGGTF